MRHVWRATTHLSEEEKKKKNSRGAWVNNLEYEVQKRKPDPMYENSKYNFPEKSPRQSEKGALNWGKTHSFPLKGGKREGILTI